MSDPTVIYVEDMLEADLDISGYLKGPKGDKGERGFSGVFVGDADPNDDSVNFWIDTSSEADDINFVIQSALEEVGNGSY